MPHLEKIIKFKHLSSIREQAAIDNKKIVLVSGCFDLFHISHAIALKKYKELGDILVVSVGRDSIISKLKGPGRPINPELHRLYTLSAIQDIDYVILGEKKLYENTSIDYYETIKELRPHILGIPPDDSNFESKKGLCSLLGIELKTVERSPHTSTTNIILGAKLRSFKAPLRVDFAGGWTDIPYLIKNTVGYVTNATIRPHITLEDGQLNLNNYPRGIGLATSTAIKLLELIELRGGRHYLETQTPKKISEDLFKLENMDLNWAIGRQDMFSIVHGGLNCFKFQNNSTEKINPDIPPETIKNLEEKLLILYIGKSRNAQNIVEEVYQNFNSGYPKYLNALKEISRCGLEFYQELRKNNLQNCSEIINKNWSAQKTFAPSTSNDYIDEIHNFALKNNAWGGKLCGAGGGGCFIFLSPDKNSLKEKIKNKFPETRSINFKFETKNIFELNYKS